MKDDVRSHPWHIMFWPMLFVWLCGGLAGFIGAWGHYRYQDDAVWSHGPLDVKHRDELVYARLEALERRLAELDAKP